MLAESSEGKTRLQDGLGLAGQGVSVNDLQPHSGLLSPLCLLYPVNMSVHVLEGECQAFLSLLRDKKKNLPVTKPSFTNSYTPPDFRREKLALTCMRVTSKGVGSLT